MKMHGTTHIKKKNKVNLQWGQGKEEESGCRIKTGKQLFLVQFQ
jgi:ribosomal protein L16/L10AE